MEAITEGVNNLNVSEQKRNRIHISNTKKSLYFYVNLAKRFMQQYNEVELSALGMAIPTCVTVAEILKNNGLAVEKKIRTLTVDMRDEPGARPIPKAKIEIVLGKTENFDELMAAEAEEREYGDEPEEKNQKLEEDVKSDKPEEVVDYDMASTEQMLEEASTEETWDILMDPTGEDEIVTGDDYLPRGWVRGTPSDLYSDPQERARDYKKYHQQHFSSNGFEVDDFPKIKGICAMTVPIDNADTDESLHELSEFAIGIYNQQKGTHYKLVGVTKATGYVCAGFVSKITFNAEDVIACIGNTFRAAVYQNLNLSKKLLSCDIHPKPKPERGTSSSKAKKGCMKKDVNVGG